MVDGSTEEREQEGTEPKRGRAIRLRTINAIIVLLAAAVAIIFLQAVQDTNNTYDSLDKASEDYIHCEQAASDLKAASNYLTIEVQNFAVTQDRGYLENYFWEVDENRRREKAVDTFEEIQGTASENLQKALEHSNELKEIELYSMRLVCEAKGYDDLIAQHLSDVELSAADAALSPEEKIARATDIVFDDEYMGYVELIESEISACKDGLVNEIEALKTENESTLHGLLTRQRVLAILLFLVFIAMTIVIVTLVLWPLSTYRSHIKNNDSLPEAGASELRDMADAYNAMYVENMRHHDTLRRKAERDHMTGLYNRSVFERLLQLHAEDHYALMLVDADYFKEINDTHGHDVGDAVLKKVADKLGHAFRTTDYPCRIGGDEFAVFMTEMTESLSYVVEAKARSIMEDMKDDSDGVPAITLSIGVAFSDGSLDGNEIFKHADRALYKVKEAGRNGFAFYDGEGE